MFEFRPIWVLLSLLSAIRFTDAVLCYSCATSDETNSCLVNWRGLRKDRYQTEDDNVLNSNVKNCTGDRKYCAIEKIESRSELVSYIRDCSDGTSFSVDLRVFRNMSPDNQTTCGYQLSGYLICITLCHGDFCNGPSAAAGFMPNTVVLVLLFHACRLFKMLLV